MAINTREGLKQYCLRRLGSPVIKINVDDTQLEDRIDDALDYFGDFHVDASETVFHKVVVTQDHIDNKRIKLDDPLIHSVLRVISIRHGDGTTSERQFSYEYQMVVQELDAFQNLDLISYAMMQQKLGLIDSLFSVGELVDYNRYKDELNLYIDWDNLAAGETYVILECHRYLDPSVAAKMYNDRWLKRYCTALFKRQWGENMKKIKNVQLPGGITMSGDEIYAESTQELQELEDKMLYEISEPVDFITR